jgi:hypothetical protein
MFMIGQLQELRCLNSRPRGAAHALAMADASLAAHFDLDDRFRWRVLDDRDIRTSRQRVLVRPEARAWPEQDVVVECSDCNRQQAGTGRA